MSYDYDQIMIANDCHPWCRAVQRDDAVRASEDGRSGPLPTLEEAISAITNHDAPPGARVSDRQCASPADTGANTELSRAGQSTPPEPSRGPKCTERESVTERRPVQPGGGGNVTGGLRTERVTLEIKHFDDNDGDSVYRWNWSEMMAEQGLGINESVRVVEDGDSWRAACESARIASGTIADITAERDAAIRERDEAKQHHARECAKCAALADKVIVLRARVAELESAAKLAPAANADGESNHAAPVASGNVEKKPMQMPSREWFERMASVDDSEMSVGGLASRVSDLESSAPAASGAAGTEPVAWAFVATDGGIVHVSTFEPVPGTATIVPLYAAPQSASGWLTAEERKWVEYMSGNCVLPYAGMKCMEAILARSSPPEVVLPPYLRMQFYGQVNREIRAALAAAGVTVKQSN